MPLARIYNINMTILFLAFTILTIYKGPCKIVYYVMYQANSVCASVSQVFCSFAEGMYTAINHTKETFRREKHCDSHAWCEDSEWENVLFFLCGKRRKPRICVINYCFGQRAISLSLCLKVFTVNLERADGPNDGISTHMCKQVFLVHNEVSSMSVNV